MNRNVSFACVACLGALSALAFLLAMATYPGGGYNPALQMLSALGRTEARLVEYPWCHYFFIAGMLFSSLAVASAGRRTSLSTTRGGTSWDETSWEYDPATGLCTAKTYADGSSVAYTYTADVLPLRTTRPGGGWTERVYDQSRREIGALSSDGSCAHSLSLDVFGRAAAASCGVGGLLYVKVNGDVYVPFCDGFGNVTEYRDSSGAVVASYSYGAFGQTVSQSGPMAGSFAFRYSTKYWDEETGLYYYGRRFYSPELMRWMTRDPIEEEGGANLYAFCENNAVNGFDALGMKMKLIYSLKLL